MELTEHLEHEKNPPQSGSNDPVRKAIYLAIESASKKWSMPIQNWKQAMSRFIIEFGDRLNGHI